MVNNAMSRGRRLRRKVLAMARFRNGVRSLRQRSTNATRELWHLVSKLPKQPAAIALHYVDDLSVDTIAKVLECSEETVKTHLSRGRHALASQLVAPTKEATHDD